jgi:hypothetical protein
MAREVGRWRDHPALQPLPERIIVKEVSGLPGFLFPGEPLVFLVDFHPSLAHPGNCVE